MGSAAPEGANMKPVHYAVAGLVVASVLLLVAIIYRLHKPEAASPKLQKRPSANRSAKAMKKPPTHPDLRAEIKRFVEWSRLARRAILQNPEPTAEGPAHTTPRHPVLGSIECNPDRREHGYGTCLSLKLEASQHIGIHRIANWKMDNPDAWLILSSFEGVQDALRCEQFGGKAVRRFRTLRAPPAKKLHCGLRDGTGALLELYESSTNVLLFSASYPSADRDFAALLKEGQDF
jgi:hypothetical protein